MKILVCVKQVADTEARFSLAADNKSLRYDKDTVYRMNRFDEFALEEALRIRETINPSVVDVVSVGAQRVRNVVLRAKEIGADNGFHVLIEQEGYLSPWTTASLIASFAAKNTYALILSGAMSEDDMHGQTGQMIAGLLNIPAASSVILQQLKEKENSIYVEREIDATEREAVILKLPELLTIQSGINTPRYPALSHVLRARQQDITTIAADELSPNYGYEKIENITSAAATRKCVFLDGTVKQKSAKLREILRGKSLLT
jgi:electron transfer flavoprotein beta subunit